MFKSDPMRHALALLLVLAFQIALAALFRFQVPDSNRDMVTYMLGQLSGMVTTALAFYFATTKSSQEKNEVIDRLSGADGLNSPGRPSGSAGDPVHTTEEPLP